MNDAPAHHAPCDGTVYAWHYCYYPENDQNNEVAFGVYDHNSANDQFILRDRSYYLLDLDSRENSFTCGTVTLSPSRQFKIYDGDRVGACMRGRQNNFLNILARNAPSDVSVVSWGQSSGKCGENNMRQSNGRRASRPSFVLHLYVNISKLNQELCSNCLQACICDSDRMIM